jgi:hypothetical protein
MKNYSVTSHDEHNVYLKPQFGLNLLRTVLAKNAISSVVLEPTRNTLRVTMNNGKTYHVATGVRRSQRQLVAEALVGRS